MATNINFQQQQANAAVPQKKKTSAKGLLFAFVFLFIVIAIFAGIKFYAKSLEKQEIALATQIREVKESVNEEELSAVIDFNERLSIVDQTLTQQSVTSGGILSDVATIVVPRVVLNSFRHERDAQTGDDVVSFDADADNFDLIAQQLVALKESPNFSDSTVSDTGLNDAGRITFTVTARYEGNASSVQPQADAPATEPVSETPDSETLEEDQGDPGAQQVVPQEETPQLPAAVQSEQGTSETQPESVVAPESAADVQL